MLRLKLLVPKKALKSVSMLTLKLALRALLKAGTGGAEADTEADSKLEAPSALAQSAYQVGGFASSLRRIICG